MLFFRMIKFKTVKTISEVFAAPLCKLIYKYRYKNLASNNKILYISPDQIDGGYTGNRYDEITFPGQIKGGCWDKKIKSKEKKLRDSIKITGIIEHFKYGVPWERTTLFKKMYRPRMNETQIAKQVQFYKNYYDEMFESIKHQGLKPPSYDNSHTPMYVCIGPKGELLWTVDGNHRLGMAIALGIKKIPVLVLRRHKQWQLIREKIYCGDNILSIKYADHPDIN